MFAIFLFAVVFSFYNWLAYESQLMSSHQQRTEVATKTTLLGQPTVASPVQLDNEVEVPKMPIIQATTEPFVALAPSDKLVLDDIATLKVRSARKVASKLGITQKLRVQTNL